MKYGYGNVKNEELIQNYKTSDDKIVITFLDGSNYEIPLTEENEVDLLNQMLEQAYDRSKSWALCNAKQKKEKALKWVIAEVSLTLLDVLNATINDSNIIRIFCGIFGCITSLCIVKNSVKYKFGNDEIKELQKYDIYLSIREALEKNIADLNLLKGVKSHQEVLNINTLDDYSLNDIKIVQRNLRRNEKYSKYFTDASETIK